ncbi:MAG: hypothetical protein R3F14_09485 [Polyangiaceae bacterium]
MTSSVSVSSSTGPTPICDNTGDCGDIGQGCIGCAVGPNGPCEASYVGCINDTECIDYANCLSECNSDLCFQKCAESFPTGQQLYNDLVVCVICDACENDCGGPGAGCP